MAEQPGAVRKFINPKSGKKSERERWIPNPGYGDPDQLEDIVGIGEVFAQSLNEPGLPLCQLAENNPRAA